MSTYEVLFSRETSQETTLTVEADSEEEAERLASEQLGNGFDEDWSESDYLGDVNLIYTVKL